MQSSQSSANTVIRAVIMLAFIIAIPLIAFNDSSLPETAKKLLEKIRPTLVSIMDKASSNGAPTKLAINNQPNLLPIQSAENGQRLTPPTPAVVPVDYQSTLQAYNADTRSEFSPGASSGSCSASPNPFLTLQDRLRQLGATYYLLETWGNQRQLYRFYCQVAVGGNVGYTRYFEATNSNPIEAMYDGLRQVESCRNSGLQ